MRLHTYTYLGIGLLLLALLACSGGNEDQTYDQKVESGLSTLNNTCTTCHGMQTDDKAVVAPTFAGIKKAYLEAAGGDKQQAVALMTAFLSNPSRELIIMEEAYSNYGPMPSFGLSLEDAQILASILLLEIDKGRPESVSASNRVEEGRKHYLALKSQLGKQLLGAIQQKGTVGALTFCNIRAIPITDSISALEGISIRRVSDRWRNPGNRANEHELKAINTFKAELIRGIKPDYSMYAYGGDTIYYFPIITNEMCLQCHGMKGKDISEETLAKLNELYPEDLATGYGLNQLRGIFAVGPY